MEHESTYSEDLNNSQNYKDSQKDGSVINAFGFSFTKLQKEPFSTPPPYDATSSPPHTPPLYSSPTETRVRRARVRPVEEEYSQFQFQAVAWTPPEGDVVSSNASSVVNTFMLSEIPPKAPPQEFYNYIPKHFSDTQRITQLILWALRYQFDKEEIPISNNEVKYRARLIARQTQMKLMEELARGNIDISPLRKPSSLSNPTQPRKLKKNTENDKKLKQLKSVTQELKQEAEEWKKCQEELNDETAKLAAENEGKDDEDMIEKIELTVDNFYDYLDDLDEDQADYFKKHIDPNSVEYEEEVPEGVSFKQPEIDDTGMLMSQKLNTIKAFSDCVDKFEHDAKSELSRCINKRSNIIPEDQEIPTVLEDEELIRKQKEIDSALNIFRMFSKSKTKKVIL